MCALCLITGNAMVINSYVYMFTHGRVCSCRSTRTHARWKHIICAPVAQLSRHLQMEVRMSCTPCGHASRSSGTCGQVVRCSRLQERVHVYKKVVPAISHRSHYIQRVYLSRFLLQAFIQRASRHLWPLQVNACLRKRTLRGNRVWPHQWPRNRVRPPLWPR